jgi:sugar (pentulose or hexulose) kinase
MTGGLAGLCTLGIDIGTSGLRAAVVQDGSRLLALEKVAVPPPLVAGQHVMQDAALWRDALAAAMAGLAGRCDLARLDGIAIDGTSGTLLAVDAAGEPVAPARLYNDAGAAGMAAGFAPLAPRETAALGATSGLAKALLLARVPGTARVLHQADWLAGQFTGRFDLSDETNALKTGYDPVARRWPAWLGDAGMDMALLPQVLPVGAVMGGVSAAAAARFGLVAGLPVLAGATDGCASFLATGAAALGDGVTALGSTLVVKLLSDRPLFAPELGIYSHRIGALWLPGGASNTGGQVLAQHFAADALAALSARIDPARPSGLDYHPLLRPGERFPVNDPALPPRLTPRPADDALFLQGMLEGMARIEAEGYAALAALGAPPLATLRSVGGGARNPAWQALRQQRLPVPFLPPLSDEAAFGSALIAARGLAGVL